MTGLSTVIVSVAMACTLTISPRLFVLEPIGMAASEVSRQKSPTAKFAPLPAASTIVCVRDGRIARQRGEVGGQAAGGVEAVRQGAKAQLGLRTHAAHDHAGGAHDRRVNLEGALRNPDDAATTGRHFHDRRIEREAVVVDAIADRAKVHDADQFAAQFRQQVAQDRAKAGLLEADEASAADRCKVGALGRGEHVRLGRHSDAQVGGVQARAHRQRRAMTAVGVVARSIVLTEYGTSNR
jgi:hypothetical protein